MENEFMKRGFLLPDGCKDLIDVVHLQAALKLRPLPTPPPVPAVAYPPITGELVIAEQMTVRDLAALLKRKPFEIVGGLMQLGTFAVVDEAIGYATIAKLARLYGFTVRKAS